MGIFDKLFKSKEEKSFEKALKEKDYKRAIEIGKEYGLNVEKIRDAEKKLAIRESIVHYNQDDASKELISNALKAVKDVSIAKKISPKAKRSSILRSIAFFQARSGNIEHALEIAKEIKDEDDFSRALIEIAFTQKDNLGEAIETLKKMPKQGLLYETLRDISLAQALSGNVEKSIETAQNIPQGKGPRAILDIIETAKSLSGDLQKDTETAQKMGDIDTLINIGMKHALSGDITQAIVIAQKLPDPNISSNLLRAFAMGYVWLDDEKKAMQIAQRISDEAFRSAVFGEIAMSFSKSSDDAIKITRQISDRNFCSMILTDIAMKQLFSGDIEKTIKVVQEIEDKNIRSEVLEVIAESIDALIQAQASIE